MVHSTKTAQHSRALAISATSAPEIDDAQLLTAKQVRALLGNCSEMHVWRLANDERYPWLGFPRVIQINRRNYFRRRAILDWVVPAMIRHRNRMSANRRHKPHRE
jgi:hypothetical protein